MKPSPGLGLTHPTRSKMLKFSCQNPGIQGKTLNPGVIRRQLRIDQLSLPQAAASQVILPSLLPCTCPYSPFPPSDIPGHPKSPKSLHFQHPQTPPCSRAPPRPQTSAIPALQGFAFLPLNAEFSRFWHQREVDQAPKSCRLPHKSLPLSLSLLLAG